MNITGDQFCVVNILPDTGSLQTIISDRVVNKLKSKPLRQVDMTACFSIKKNQI